MQGFSANFNTYVKFDLFSKVVPPPNVLPLVHLEELMHFVSKATQLINRPAGRPKN
jgi:hypothetical protein